LKQFILLVLPIAFVISVFSYASFASESGEVVVKKEFLIEENQSSVPVASFHYPASPLASEVNCKMQIRPTIYKRLLREGSQFEISGLTGSESNPKPTLKELVQGAEDLYNIEPSSEVRSVDEFYSGMKKSFGWYGDTRIYVYTFSIASKESGKVYLASCRIRGPLRNIDDLLEVIYKHSQNFTPRTGL
jgi:hypothetical protein